MRTDTPVVVLRLDHYGALGVFRSLGRLGVAVYGVHRSDDALALRSRYARGFHRCDVDGDPPARSVARLLAIAESLGGRPLLVPTNDETALFVAAHAAELRPAFRFQDNPLALVERLYDKRSMYRLACELGIATAHTIFPRGRDDVRAFAETARFPVMLKGADGIRVARRTGHKMRIVRGAAELLDAWERMEDPARPDLMLQEYIPGGEDAQWMFNGYFDERSRCRFGVVGRKLRQTPPYTGMTSLGVIEPNDEIDRVTRALVEAIGYRGILDIGYRFDARDGRYKVLDVNPRLGATFRLFVGADGLDVVRALYLDLTGQAVPPSTARPGRRWLVEDLDLASSVRYHRDGVLGARQWLRSFAGVRECAWLARDDVRPFAALCRQLVVRAARKAGKRLRLLPSTIATLPAAAHQAEVTRHFGGAARDWERIYRLERLHARFIRERHARALRWVESVPLPRAARVLEIGCGAGQTAVALAQRGYRVHALDATPQMLALAAGAARAAGVTTLTTALGDAHALELADGDFDVVIALGVLPWLHGEAQALAEMARVLRPGGWLIATADNRRPLHRLLDPRATPSLAPARAAVKRLLRRDRDREPAAGLRARSHDAGALEALLRARGLETVRRSSIGFGPFSLLGRKLLSDAADVTVHERLQRLADRDWPLLRSSGAHHVVLARKIA
jgi:D-aspartate ligase